MVFRIAAPGGLGGPEHHQPQSLVHRRVQDQALFAIPFFLRTSIRDRKYSNVIPLPVQTRLMIKKVRASDMECRVQNFTLRH